MKTLAFPGLRNILCDFISFWFLVVKLMCALCACHDVMRFCGATWIPAFWEAFEYWNSPDSMRSYDLENGSTQRIRKIKGGEKLKGVSFYPWYLILVHLCTEHRKRPWERCKPCCWAMGQLSSSRTQCWVVFSLKEVWTQPYWVGEYLSASPFLEAL